MTRLFCFFKFFLFYFFLFRGFECDNTTLSLLIRLFYCMRLEWCVCTLFYIRSIPVILFGASHRRIFHEKLKCKSLNCDTQAKCVVAPLVVQVSKYKYENKCLTALFITPRAQAEDSSIESFIRIITTSCSEKWKTCSACARQWKIEWNAFERFEVLSWAWCWP